MERRRGEGQGRGGGGGGQGRGGGEGVVWSSGCSISPPIHTCTQECRAAALTSNTSVRSLSKDPHTASKCPPCKTLPRTACSIISANSSFTHSAHFSVSPHSVTNWRRRGGRGREEGREREGGGGGDEGKWKG